MQARGQNLQRLALAANIPSRSFPGATSRKGNPMSSFFLYLETGRVLKRHERGEEFSWLICWTGHCTRDSINTILTAMRDNRRIASVQESGCALLGRLSQYDDNNPKMTDIGAAGGIVRIVEGMEQHPRDEAVQRHGCITLRHLVWCNDDNRRRVTQTRAGIETVIKATNNHSFSWNTLARRLWICVCSLRKRTARKPTNEEH